MSSSINPRPPHNNDSLSVNKPYRAVQIKFSRDTGHKSTGYEAQIDGIRGTQLTGFEAQVSRDTRHKKSGDYALQALYGVPFRIFKKSANLSLIFF